MYWQFGWFGVLLGGAICGIFTCLWLCYISRRGLSGLGIYCVTVVPLTFVNAPASVDVLIETVLVALPYLLVASLLEHSMKGAAAIREEIAAS